MAGVTVANAQSFLLQYYSNDGLVIVSDAPATYSTLGGLTSSATSVGPVSPGGILLTPGGSSPLTTRTHTSAIGPLLPDSGALKDSISSLSEFQYHIDDTTTPDSFSLTLNAHASALTAQLSGQNADAKLVVNWTMIVEGQSLTTPTISYALPNFNGTTTAGTWSATWTQLSSINPVITTDVTNGGTENVVGGFGYRYDVNYTLDVPFGTDPDINETFDGTVTVAPVPEPATVWQMALLTLPALGLVARLRRR